MTLAAIVCDAWEHRMWISENPFRTTAFNEILGLPRVTYRQHLDRVRINFSGENIPRIAIVRDNLWRLGNIRLDPERLR